MIVEKLELRLYDDGTGNLNFWDYANGGDVVVDITEDGKLLKVEYEEDDEGELQRIEPSVEISFQEYIKLVKESVESRTL